MTFLFLTCFGNLRFCIFIATYNVSPHALILKNLQKGARSLSSSLLSFRIAHLGVTRPALAGHSLIITTSSSLPHFLYKNTFFFLSWGDFIDSLKIFIPLPTKSGDCSRFKSLPLNNPHVTLQGPISIYCSYLSRVPGKFALDATVAKNTILIKSGALCNLWLCHFHCQSDQPGEIIRHSIPVSSRLCLRATNLFCQIGFARKFNCCQVYVHLQCFFSVFSEVFLPHASCWKVVGMTSKP